ncbi:MAG TPA: glycosyltransferase family 1 protein [Arachnia sp.]|nr:glycosyltransferase family 1 protein [Arachnia sp.]HMT85149.1 glycosyltransferase family 1 protein [Arachnia sp.]
MNDVFGSYSGSQLDRPIRVLQSVAGLGRGGLEQLIMNWYRSIDRSKIQFDFVAEEGVGTRDHEAEIRDLGGRIYYVPRYTSVNPLTYAQRWRQLLSDHPEWQVIHAHHTTPALIYLTVARVMGRTCIAHSHNTDGQKSWKALTRRLLGRPLNIIAHRRLACGVDAGRAMFGTSRFEVVPNSINIMEFAFDPDSRSAARVELGVEDTLVVGHIGRFTEAKNHAHVVRVFEALASSFPAARLLLIGEGQLRTEIERLVRMSGLEEKVQFLGSRADIGRLMSAMDVFLLPSLYEGLPVTLVEAQANGLPCVISSSITDEVRLTSHVLSVDLDAPVEEWVSAVSSAPIGQRERVPVANELKGGVYDVEYSVHRMSTLYSELAAK